MHSIKLYWYCPLSKINMYDVIICMTSRLDSRPILVHVRADLEHERVDIGSRERTDNGFGIPNRIGRGNQGNCYYV